MNNIKTMWQREAEVKYFLWYCKATAQFLNKNILNLILHKRLIQNAFIYTRIMHYGQNRWMPRSWVYGTTLRLLRMIPAFKKRNTPPWWLAQWE